MLRTLLHHVVSIPWVFDCVQTLVDGVEVRRRLASHLAQVRPSAVIVDIGGGTGAYRQLCPPDSRYVCLDTDWFKLRGNMRRHGKGLVILSDGRHCPLKSGSVDIVLCTKVSHHLSEQVLGEVIGESRRILKPKGVYVFLDAVWAPARMIGRLLWKYDRGSSPRTAQTLRAAVLREFERAQDEQFAVYHEYLLLTASKQAGP